LASICAAAKHPIFKVVWRATLRRRRNFGLPLVRDYQNDLQAIGSTDFTYMGLEGYLNGLVMITALRAAGPELTEEKLMLENVDLDFKAFRIRFGANIREGNHQVFLTRIKSGKAVPVDKLNPADYVR
jgi:hypothetical protein